MALETDSICPLGATCEGIDKETNKAFRCAWYQHFKGVDAAGEETDDEACAIAWTPLLLLEQIRGIAGVQEATESARNEQVNSLQHLATAVASRPSVNILEGESK
jgi:hypothetical protein